jgi:hypothetical protein
MSIKMKWGLALATALILLCFVGIANAQTYSKSVKVSWKLPVTWTDGTPLVATDVTKVMVYIGVGPISDNFSGSATVEVTAVAVPVTKTINVVGGGKVYVRVRACAGLVCGPISDQATLDVPNLTPGMPTNITIELVIT